MKRSYLLPCACLLVLVAGEPSRSADEAKVADAAYYPLKVGTTWQYKSGDKSLVVKVTKHEKVGDVMCALLETSLDGSVLGREQISSSDKGVFRHTVLALKPDSPVKIQNAKMKKGDTWTVETKLGTIDLKIVWEVDEETVEVPAGKYNAVVTKTREFKSDGQEMKATIWYAKGIGMVKTTMELPGGNTVELELEKFTPGE